MEVVLRTRDCPAAEMSGCFISTHSVPPTTLGWITVPVYSLFHIIKTELTEASKKHPKALVLSRILFIFIIRMKEALKGETVATEGKWVLAGTRMGKVCGKSLGASGVNGPRKAAGGVVVVNQSTQVWVRNRTISRLAPIWRHCFSCWDFFDH